MRLRPPRRLAQAAALAAALVFGACGGSDSSYGTNPNPPPDDEPPASNPRTVSATPQLTFAPSTLTVQVGQSVTFEFGSVAHNVFFDSVAGAPADIPGSNVNTSAVRTFGTAGTFPYECHLHVGMSGTVVVQ